MGPAEDLYLSTRRRFKTLFYQSKDSQMTILLEHMHALSTRGKAETLAEPLSQIQELLDDNPGAWQWRNSRQKTLFHLAIQANSSLALQMLCNKRSEEGKASHQEWHLPQGFPEAGVVAGCLDGALRLGNWVRLKKQELKEMMLGEDALNACDSKGYTPLHVAACHGQEALIIKLLEQPGIECNPVDDEGNTPLHLAVQQGHVAAVSALLERGASNRYYNERGLSPFLLGIQEGHLEVLKRFPALLDEQERQLLPYMRADPLWGFLEGPSVWELAKLGKQQHNFELQAWIDGVFTRTDGTEPELNDAPVRRSSAPSFLQAYERQVSEASSFDDDVFYPPDYNRDRELKCQN